MTTASPTGACEDASTTWPDNVPVVCARAGNASRKLAAPAATTVMLLRNRMLPPEKVPPEALPRPAQAPLPEAHLRFQIDRVPASTPHPRTKRRTVTKDTSRRAYRSLGETEPSAPLPLSRLRPA